MSFVSDTLLAGGTTLHIARGGHHGEDAGKRVGQSQAGRLEPLLRFVKDPLGVLGVPKDGGADREAKDGEHRRQLLHLRMREVGCLRVCVLSFR